MKNLIAAVFAMFVMDAQAKQYEIFTDLGSMYIQTHEREAPITSENFDTYVRDGFYSHLIFHRVIDGFMIQTGGVNTVLKEQETRDPIENESRNGLKNVRGALGMARWSEPNSASSQFYINLIDNPHLDPSGDGFGYTVFASVICGMNVADTIAKEPVRVFEAYQHLPNIPVRLIWIKEITSDHHGYSKCQHQQDSADS